MGLMKEFIQKGTIKGHSQGSNELDLELLHGEQFALQERIDVLKAFKPDDYETIIGEYNSGFDVFIDYVKSDNHYLAISRDILGGKIHFQNLTDRIVMGIVLNYQVNGTKINKDEILNKAKDMAKSYVPIVPPTK